jgi:hypothetical protein
MPKSRTVLSVIACLVVAGPALGAAVSYDGTYSGERSPTNGVTSVCAGQGSVTVTNETLTWDHRKSFHDRR